jgi:hypothetical protein
MALIEVYEGEHADSLLFEAEFDFLPRIGEYLARDAGDYFKHYKIVEIWHRQDVENGKFRASMQVMLDD